MAKFDIGQTVVDLQTGQKFRVADASLDLDPARYGLADPGFQATPGKTAGAAAQFRAQEKSQAPLTTPERELISANRPLSRAGKALAGELGSGLQSTGQGGLGAVLGPLQFLNAPAIGAGAAVGTTAQNVLAQIPGLGGASGVVPAAGAALADAATQLLTGPGIIKSVISGGKAAAKGVGEILAPGAVRRAGGEAIAKRLGSRPDVVERIFATPESQGLFEVARKTGEIGVEPLSRTVRDVLRGFKSKIAKAPARVTKFLGDISENLKGRTTIDYSDAIDLAQDIRLEGQAALSGARANPRVAKGLLEARDKLITELDKINPAIRQANAAYRKESATLDIMNSVRSGAPGTNLEKLLENDPSIAKAFGKQAVKDILDIANALNDVAGATPMGGFRQILSAVTEPLGQMLSSDGGRAILRQTLLPTGNRTPRGLVFAVQLWRSQEAIAAE